MNNEKQTIWVQARDVKVGDYFLGLEGWPEDIRNEFEVGMVKVFQDEYVGSATVLCTHEDEQVATGRVSEHARYARIKIAAHEIARVQR